MDNWTDGLDDILGDPSQDNATIRVLREKIKADAKALEKLSSEVATLRDGQKGDIVGKALKSAGVPQEKIPLAADLYKGDLEATAVSAWATQYAPLFAGGATASPGENPEEKTIAGTPAQGTVDPVFTPDTQAAFQRMITAGVDGVPGSNFNDAYGALTNAGSMEDLMAAIQTFS